LSRSEFVVDEGYQFVWYDPAQGVDFVTDNAGTLSLGFKFNGDFRYRLDQFAQEPTVTTSYNDLVKCHVDPFQDLRVNVFFQVYSSRIAIEDVTVTNLGTSDAQLSVYPFFRHTNDVVTDAAVLPEHDGIVFRHNEHPDGWTTGHQVPYQETLVDVYLIDTTANSYGGYAELGVPGGQRESKGKDAAPANYCVEWGRVYHADGTPCTHLPPQAQQVIVHNAFQSEILTESAPKWGDVDPNIPGNGYQGCELGHFVHPAIVAGDSFTVIFSCLATGQRGIGTGKIPDLPAPGGVQVDIQLAPGMLPPIPQNVGVQFAQDSSAAVVSWEYLSSYRYAVYRRTALTPGHFDIVADTLDSAGYLDLGLNPDSLYGYVVHSKDSGGQLSGHSPEVGNAHVSSTQFLSDVLNASLSQAIPTGNLKVLAMQRNFSVPAGKSAHLRIIRGVTEGNGNIGGLVSACRDLRTLDLQQSVTIDEGAYAAIPRLTLSNSDEELMYWSAFSMMRQCMLPPEGECSCNYNVYSREPTWGWGHAGQVFHENLSMLAYAFMDWKSAQNSQRVFSERMAAQAVWPAGFVPYRVGPYLDEVNYLAGEYSSSAPWFNYENWEIFNVSADTAFLREMYAKGVELYNFWVTQRDNDSDGLSEWGGHAFWESVRDYNVIWDLLGGWADPHSANKVEALDLNCELVMEAKSLSKMASALGKTDETLQWMQKAQARADLINTCMWDSQTRFYYHVNKTDHSFTYATPNDLKRKEQMGLLPLWAGIAGAEQAQYLLGEVMDSTTFGRPFGIPLLAHNDPYGGYDAHSVYPEWDFLVFKGLLDYGFVQEARTLADRLFAGVLKTLRDHHDFYESYYCDEPRPSDSWLHTYIWTGVVARMLLDLHQGAVEVQRDPSGGVPQRFELSQNYPNPFNPTTVVSYQVPVVSEVKLVVYDMLGREVSVLVNEKRAPGRYDVRFDGSRLASGVYYYRLQARQTDGGQVGDFMQSRKMLLVR